MADILRTAQRDTGLTVAIDVDTDKAPGRSYLPFTVGDVDTLRMDLRQSGEVVSTAIEYS